MKSNSKPLLIGVVLVLIAAAVYYFATNEDMKQKLMGLVESPMAKMEKDKEMAAAETEKSEMDKKKEMMAECGELTITEMNWASSAIVTEISKFLMENGYGCKVTKVPSSTVPAMTSVAETGEPHVLTELWVNSAPKYAELEAEGKIVTAGNVLTDGGEEGWWIPKYLADERPELMKLENILANPELVGGIFHNCPDGWGCRTINDNLVKAWGMDQGKIEVFNHGSGETLAASIASAFSDRKPWFGYYWAPTAILGKFEMVKVDMGAYVKEVHACNVKTDCESPGKSAYASSPVLTAVTKSFADDNPAIFDLMSNMSFPNSVMNGLLAWQDKEKASAEEAAVYFLSENKEVWGAWVNDEAKSNLSNLLK